MRNSINTFKIELKKLERSLVLIIEELKKTKRPPLIKEKRIVNTAIHFYEFLDKFVIGYQTTKRDLLKAVIELDQYLKSVDCIFLTKKDLREIANRMVFIENCVNKLNIIERELNKSDVNIKTIRQKKLFNKYLRLISHQYAPKAYKEYCKNCIRENGIDNRDIKKMMASVKRDTLRYLSREEANKAIVKGTYHKPKVAPIQNHGLKHTGSHRILPEAKEKIKKYQDQINAEKRYAQYGPTIKATMKEILYLFKKLEKLEIKYNQSVRNIAMSFNSTKMTNFDNLTKSFFEQLEYFKAEAEIFKIVNRPQFGLFYLKYMTCFDTKYYAYNKQRWFKTVEKLWRQNQNALIQMPNMRPSDFMNPEMVKTIAIGHLLYDGDEFFEGFMQAKCKNVTLPTTQCDEPYKKGSFKYKEGMKYVKQGACKMDTQENILKNLMRDDKAFQSSLLSSPKSVEAFFSIKNISQFLKSVPTNSILYAPAAILSGIIGSFVINSNDIKDKDQQYAVYSSIGLTVNALYDVALFKYAKHAIKTLPKTSYIASFFSKIVGELTLAQFASRGFALGMAGLVGFWTGGKLLDQLKKTRHANQLCGLYYKHLTYIGIPFRSAGNDREFYFNQNSLEWDTRWKAKPHWQQKPKVRDKAISISHRFDIRPDLITKAEHAFFFLWQNKDYRQKYMKYLPILNRISEFGVVNLPYFEEEKDFLKPSNISYVDVNAYKIDKNEVDKRDWYGAEERNLPILSLKCPKTKIEYPVPHDKVFTKENLQALEDYIRVVKSNPKRAKKLLKSIIPVNTHTKAQRISTSNKLALKSFKEQRAIRLMYYRSKLNYYMTKILVYINYFGTGSTKVHSQSDKIKGFIKRYIKDNAMDQWKKKKENGTRRHLSKIEKKLIEIKGYYKQKSKGYKKRHGKYSSAYSNVVKHYKKYKEKYMAVISKLEKEEILESNMVGEKFTHNIVICYDSMSKKSSRKELAKNINGLRSKYKKAKVNKNLNLRNLSSIQRTR